MDPHQHALIEAARRLGIEVERRDPGADEVVYRRGERRARVRDGRVYPSLTPSLDALCQDKQATKDLFARCGLPVPRGVVITDRDHPEDRIRTLLADCPDVQAWVCKPLHGTNGEGVVMGLHGCDELLAAIDAVGEDAPLIEAQVPGRDLRMQIIDSRLIAACEREPARVLGDGETPLAALIERHATWVQAQNPQNRLVVDAETRALLDAQRVSLDSVPAAGRVVRLKRVANMSQGAIAIDVTDRLHPEYARWARTLAEALGLPTFALDVIVTDPGADPPSSGAVALEINAQAQWLHHTFSERRRHDIPALILEWLLGPADGVDRQSSHQGGKATRRTD